MLSFSKKIVESTLNCYSSKDFALRHFPRWKPHRPFLQFPILPQIFIAFDPNTSWIRLCTWLAEQSWKKRWTLRDLGLSDSDDDALRDRPCGTRLCTKPHQIQRTINSSVEETGSSVICVLSLSQAMSCILCQQTDGRLELLGQIFLFQKSPSHHRTAFTGSRLLNGFLLVFPIIPFSFSFIRAVDWSGLLPVFAQTHTRKEKHI